MCIDGVYSFYISSNGITLTLILAVTLIGIGYVLFYYRKLARTLPTNYILLSIFTLCEAWLLSYSVNAASPKDVALVF